MKKTILNVFLIFVATIAISVLIGLLMMFTNIKCRSLLENFTGVTALLSNLLPIIAAVYLLNIAGKRFNIKLLAIGSIVSATILFLMFGLYLTIDFGSIYEHISACGFSFSTATFNITLAASILFNCFLLKRIK